MIENIVTLVRNVVGYILVSVFLGLSIGFRTLHHGFMVLTEWAIVKVWQEELEDELPSDPLEIVIEHLYVQLTRVSPGGPDYNPKDHVNAGYRNALVNMIHDVTNIKRRRDSHE